MRGLNWRLSAAGVVVSLIVGGIALATPVAAEPIDCNATVDARPVVLEIHGLDGKPENFTDDRGPNGTMDAAIRSITGVNVVDPFDYEDFNLKWVTDEHLGQALANKINCLSDASREAGGDGRIVVVANSLGGQVLRQALNQDASVHTSPDKVGLAIMIGSPNLGTRMAILGKAIYRECSGTFPFMRCWPSPAAKALVPGSPELQALPPLPSTVSQRAIASDIVIGNAHFGDTVVSVGSATAEYTTQHPGDGRFVLRCRSAFDLCTHGELLRNPRVQDSVVQGIGEYAASLDEPTPTPESSGSPSPAPESSGSPMPNP
jgi:hypothetical protein